MHAPLDTLAAGARLVRQPGLWPWALLPLAANILIFGLAIGWLHGVAGELLAGLSALTAGAPGWLAGAVDLLAGLAQLLALLLLLLAAAWVFTGVLHLIAAPINGLLAERAWARHTGRPVPAVPLARMIRRTLARSWQALRYWAVRALGLGLFTLLIGWIPLLNGMLPLLWFLFGAWMLAVTYLDYPADNLGVDFESMIARLHTRRTDVLVFGAAVFGLTLVPVVNFVIMPVAVCAATIMWADFFEPAPPASATSPAPS
ncbi:MAG: sulfate transporter CysZ [Gammaproteobacteria bacterium]